jgi:hypothetical protein
METELSINEQAELIHQRQLEKETNERWERWEKERQAGVDRDKVLFAILNSRSITGAARLAGVNRGTIYNCKKDPVFTRALEDMRQEQRDRLEDDFFELAEKAASVIREALEAPAEIAIKRNYSHELKVKTALRFFELARRPAELPIENNGQGITARASVPGNGAAIALVMAKNESS